ncbi:MAG: N-acetylmuramoyl-L-alanine amidase [Woeseiaceae bacterium]|nr:N-acetylmuramoyl-L-alanine amidase [Woeseiaceae bacterium]
MIQVRLLLLIPLLLAAMAHGATVENVRIWAENDKTRVVLDLSQPVKHKIITLRGPDRLVIDLSDSRLAGSVKTMPGGAGAVRAIRTGVRSGGELRVVLDLKQTVRSRSFTAGPNSQYGDRLVIDLHPSGNLQAVKRASENMKPGRDIVIAIDPGHGGHDPGAVGRGKTREKDIVLSISRLLAERINAEPGMKAVLVRGGDYYVDHRKRTDIARRNQADLFVSVHADAVEDRRARGASVYALSHKGASDEEARLLAQRENAAVSIGGVQISDKEDDIAAVLLDLSQTASLSASLDVGNHVARELGRVGRMHRKTVQQAGFLVLKSPDMPSILVETAYISNPDEEKKLRSKSHQGKLANAILAGVRNYFYTNPPPDTRIAAEIRRSPKRNVKHVIARGDTLSEIAERYNVSTTAIRRANRLSNDNIRIGQTLSIPIYAGT